MSSCRTLRSYRLLGIALLVAATTGCQPKPVETLFPVTGHITLDGQPLGSGSLTLRSDGPDVNWQQPTGMVEESGKYRVFTNGREGAPPGRYRVIAFVTENARLEAGAARPGLPQSLIPARYNDPRQTPLRLEVVAQPTANAYDLELTSRDK